MPMFLSAKKFDKNKVWGDLQNGSLLLTDIIESSALHVQFVYQLEGMESWLAEQLACLEPLSPDKMSEERWQAPDWYLARKGEIFGPLSLPALASLQLHHLTRADDLCFSLKFRLKLKLAHLPEFFNAPANVQPYHVNRRWKRFSGAFQAALVIDNKSVPVTTLNLSEGGTAVICPVALESGQSVHFVLNRFESVPEFRCSASILQCRPIDGGFQVSLEFGALNSQDRKSVLSHETRGTSSRKAG